jgi:hypothetical protein
LSTAVFPSRTQSDVAVTGGNIHDALRASAHACGVKLLGREGRAEAGQQDTPGPRCGPPFSFNAAVWSKFATGHLQESCWRSAVTVRFDWSEFSTGKIPGRSLVIGSHRRQSRRICWPLIFLRVLQTVREKANARQVTALRMLSLPILSISPSTGAVA